MLVSLSPYLGFMENKKTKTESKIDCDLTSEAGWESFKKAITKEGVLNKSKTARPSILELKDRKLKFVIRVKIGSSEFRGAYATREEAEQAASDIENLRKEIPQIRAAKTFRVKGGEYKTLMTLAGLMRLWFETPTTQKPSTKLTMYHVFDQLIAPTLGSKMLHQIEESDVEEILHKLKNNNGSSQRPITIRTCLSHLDKLAGKKLKYPKEYRLQFIPVEVLQGLKFKKARHHKAVSPEVLSNIIKRMFEVKEHAIPHLNQFTPYMYLFASLTGVRGGELRALRWGDLNSENLSVERTVTRQGVKTSSLVKIVGIETPVQKIVSREYIADTPKTSGSCRTVPLNYELKSVLPELKALWTKLMKKPPTSDDLIFCVYQDLRYKNDPQGRSSRFGEFIGATNFSRSLKTYFRHAKLNEFTTMHQLRASFATTLLRTSPNPSTALVNMKALLGHGDINTTSIYAQSDAREKQQLVDSMPAFLGRDDQLENAEELNLDNMTKQELLAVIKKLKG